MTSSVTELAMYYKANDEQNGHMFPLTLIAVLFLLVLVQALVVKAVHKAGGAGRTMTTGYPRDPFDPQRR